MPAVNKKKLIELLILIILLSVIGFILTQQISRRLSQTIAPSPSLSPSPSPCVASRIPVGKQVYRYSHGKDVVGPKLQVVTLDPNDPQEDQRISITAEIKHDSPVTNATLYLVTDNKTVEEKMKLISGEPNNGIWATEIEINDTYLCTYELNFDLQSETGNYLGGMVFRP